MKVFFETIILAFSMYSRIPMPKCDWNESNMRYSLAVFPWIGAFLAAMIWLLHRLLIDTAGTGAIIFAASAVFLNIIITGGIHLDGFADVIDALSSHKDREEKLRILKDPHIGAFALIYTVPLILLQFAAFFCISDNILLIIPVFVISRTLAALLIIKIPKARADGLAVAFAPNSSAKIISAILYLYLLLMALLTLMHSYVIGIFLILLAIASVIRTVIVIKRQFGGITGDLAGYYVSLYETLSLFLIAVL